MIVGKLLITRPQIDMHPKNSCACFLNQHPIQSNVIGRKKLNLNLDKSRPITRAIRRKKPYVCEISFDELPLLYSQIFKYQEE